MSVRTRPMFAIPFAINLRSVAVILGRCGILSCNERVHGPPMFAIPTPDVCRSLQLTPFPRDRLSPEAAVLVKAVALQLARDLPAGCFWVDGRPRDAGGDRRAAASPEDGLRQLQRSIDGGLKAEDCRSIAAGRRSRRRDDGCVACRRGWAAAAERSAPTQREWQQQDDDRDQTHNEGILRKRRQPAAWPFTSYDHGFAG
jgi:hypothetical protein